MSKSYEEIASEIIIAAINKAPSSGNLIADAERIAEAFKVVYEAVKTA